MVDIASGEDKDFSYKSSGEILSICMTELQLKAATIMHRAVSETIGLGHCDALRV